MGFYIFFLIIAIILTCVFIGAICFGDLREDGVLISIVLSGLFAMIAWSGFFYGFGVKHGSYETAKGHYKTLYLYDKEVLERLGEKDRRD